MFGIRPHIYIGYKRRKNIEYLVQNDTYNNIPLYDLTHLVYIYNLYDPNVEVTHGKSIHGGGILASDIY